MRIGVGQERLALPVGTVMAGFAARKGPSTGESDPLTVSVVVTTDDRGAGSALVVADLLAVERDLSVPVAAVVADRLGVSAEHVTVQATHTHSGPVTSAGFGPVPTDLLPELCRATGSAAAMAARSVGETGPAFWRVGLATTTDVVVNRRAGEDVTDPVLRTAVATGRDGEVRAVLVQLACHPVLLGPANRDLSADWPGVVRRRLGEDLGVPVVVVQGCCGQINPTGGADPDADLRGGSDADRGRPELERLAARIVSSAHEAIADGNDIPSAADPDDTVSFADRPVDLPFQAAVRHPPEQARVGLHDWGGLRVLCLPAEPFVELALELRRTAGDERLFVAGYCDHVPGYLPYPRRLYDHGGYEITTAHEYYGRPAALDPAAGEQVFAAAADLIDRR